jgi:alcohol dehydrogenase class IV
MQENDRAASMTMPAVRHATPAFRTYAGEDALSFLTRELDRTGVRRVLVVTTRSLSIDEGVMSRIQNALGGRCVGLFGEAREHSPLPVVEKAAATLVSTDADGVVAVGGGSAIVTARAAVVVAAEARSVRELCTRLLADGRLFSPKLTSPKVPQWIVPSTPTTAYAKAGAAVRDPGTGQRLALFDPKARAQGVFFDPLIASTAPDHLVRSSSLNAFAMSVDGLQAVATDPLAEALLRQALVTVSEHVDRIGAGEPVSRIQLMFGALLAGQGSDFVSSGLAQALAHSLGPLSTVGNGIVEAMMLPHTMRFNRGVTDEGLSRVAHVLSGTAGADPDSAIVAVEAILRRAKVPARLRDVGVSSDSLPIVVDHVAHDWAAASAPRPASPDQLRTILQQAW